MPQADVSSIAYFAPIAAFLLVFLVVYAILVKSKILGENKLLNLFVSLFLATMFVAFASARQYVQTIVPWFAVMLVALFLVLILVGLVGKPSEFMNKGIGIAFVVLLGLVFLISALFVFSNVFISLLPGPGYGMNADPKLMYFLDWLYSPRIAGTLLIIIISVAVSWVLVKSK
ncbi:MAG: hypothetical protein Q7S74_06295 [Nanoarchaeota archaeon]|nr:hypothetical protein [Nanoarchaeota archaeon]